MHFFGSERGLLATPPQCGTYPVETEFVPWDENLTIRHATSFFTVSSGPNGQPCPGATRPFDPHVAAGTTNSTAGRFAPFVLDVRREDGDQNLTAVNVDTPPGFSASIRGIPYCPESALALLKDPAYPGRTEQASPACPAASKIGTATTSEGAGTHPLFTPGKVYLAGPYRGAPLSLVVVVPAVSGPYDLGNVVVRSAIHVDPTTAQIATVSDPIPTILDGIPLRLRSIQINLDRPNFTLNPTNCDPFAVHTGVVGDQGAAPDVVTHFQVSSCPNLGFGPKLGMSFTGGTKRRGHPAIHATLATNPGDANIGRASVTLPPSEQLDNAHVKAPCTRPQFAANQCPPSTLLGEATAQSPLLDQPLSGPVYLVTSDRTLPDLVARLNGQIHIDLRAHIDSVNGGLRTTFDTVPDVPVSAFHLDLVGGAKGLVVNSSSLCGGKFRATADFTGQNGRRVTRRPKLKAACGAARHKRSRHRAGKA